MRVLNQIGCVWKCWYYPQKEILSHQKFSTMRSYNNGKVSLVLLTRTPLPRIQRVLSQGPSKWCSPKSTLRQTTTRLVQIVGHCGVCFQSLISSTETTLWSIQSDPNPNNCENLPKIMDYCQNFKGIVHDYFLVNLVQIINYFLF